MVSDFIYFALIPIAIYAILYITIESMEKMMHKYIASKLKIYLIGGAICVLIVIIIVILSFFIKI